VAGQGQVLGRDAALARIEAFLDGGVWPRALLVEGSPGAGKTTLWEAGIEAARRRRLRVLSARPSGAEAQLSFSALTDLLEDVDVASARGVPEPQRDALQVALLRAPPGDAKPGSRAVATGLLNVLRSLSARPLVVAIDDAQWLDRASSDGIAFAARRLEDRKVLFLVAKRSGHASALADALPGADRLPVEPLSLGAIRKLLVDRLGLVVTRRVLRQIFQASGGNPLYALELGRALAESGAPEIGEEIPVPKDVEELVGIRIGRVARPARRLLLALALSPDLSAPQLEALSDRETVEQALNDGLFADDGHRIRPSHPLISAAARTRSRPAERRELHRALAGLVEGDELRARHLALSTDEPDEALAATIAAAASSAAARGGGADATLLAEHALRLTPVASPSRPDRVLELAGYLDNTGEIDRLVELLEPELDSLPPGAARVRALRLLCEGAPTWDESVPINERALAESESEPALHAFVVAEVACDRAVLRYEQIAAAEESALVALGPAKAAGPDVERDVLQALAWARALLGKPIDDIRERSAATSGPGFSIASGPERIHGQRLLWRGEIDAARREIRRLLEAADERGEPVSYVLQRLHLIQVELRAGAWDEAERLLDEWGESAGEGGLAPMYPRCRALLAAGRGLPEQTEEWAARTVEDARAIGVLPDELDAHRARGIAFLLRHENAAAADALIPVWEHDVREGLEEPGVLPFEPDLVEALAELGRLDEAEDATGRLERLTNEQDHPWGRPTSARCRALLLLATNRYDEAAPLLRDATEEYERLGLRFDAARALLALGRAERRSRKWGAARESLERSVALFEEIGSPGWAEDARNELSRVGARRPSPAGELTSAEERVARLAADGLSNKEIAAALVVTIPTVEGHLTKIYAKLGVRSRAQLVSRLA